MDFSGKLDALLHSDCSNTRFLLKQRALLQARLISTYEA
jgi:hypothetical protein